MGELLTFHDIDPSLPAIDRLQGFYRGSARLDRGALVPVQVNEAVLPA